MDFFLDFAATVHIPVPFGAYMIYTAVYIYIYIGNYRDHVVVESGQDGGKGQKFPNSQGCPGLQESKKDGLVFQLVVSKIYYLTWGNDPILTHIFQLG